jgi:hypothetical protein
MNKSTLDDPGLMRIDSEWRARVESTLPYLSMRVAVANEVDPRMDGILKIGEEQKVNAEVNIGGEWPVYTINTGSFYALFDLVHQYIDISHGGCLRDGISEAYLSPVSDKRFRDYTQMNRNGPHWHRYSFESGTSNHRVSSLVTAGISFLILHEQSHYFRGHVRLVRAHARRLQASDIWFEAGGAGTDDHETARMMRALEWDADLYAMSMLLRTSPFESDREPLTRGWLHGNETAVIDSYLGASAVMLLLNANGNLAGVDKKTNKHPSASVRLTSLINVLKSVFVTCGMTQTEISRHLEYAEEQIGAMTKILRSSGCDLGEIGTSPTTILDFEEEGAEILETMRAIRDDLDQYMNEIDDLYKPV